MVTIERVWRIWKLWFLLMSFYVLSMPRLMRTANSIARENLLAHLTNKLEPSTSKTDSTTNGRGCLEVRYIELQ